MRSFEASKFMVSNGEFYEFVKVRLVGCPAPCLSSHAITAVDARFTPAWQLTTTQSERWE